MIGIFDSGLGGLTVVKEALRQLPGCGIVYFGDTARMPYGNKSAKLVVSYALEDADFLVSRGAKAIIVACNTASALAVPALRKHLRVPVFEVVTPAVEKAAQVTKGRVGVIATRATVLSGVYAEKMKAKAPDAAMFAAACPLFVPLVEEGWLRAPETRMIAKTYLRPLRLRNIDTLILGCTHYPFLRPVIAEAAGRGVRLVDPAKEAVSRLKEAMAADPALARLCRGTSDHRFFVSDTTGNFQRLASQWLGRPIILEEANLSEPSSQRSTLEAHN